MGFCGCLSQFYEQNFANEKSPLVGVMWKLFLFFAVTTREQPQEGRVETVNCVMDCVSVCVCFT